LLHMPRETAKALKEMGYHKIGLLATEGTLKAGIYHDPLEEAGISMVIPTEREQAHVTRLIYDVVKAGRYRPNLQGIRQVTRRLFDDGAETLLLARTGFHRPELSDHAIT
ncbi:MAG: aspartate/glutamate racemase family protein, partial [Lachnospiraceae bacterium]